MALWIVIDQSNLPAAPIGQADSCVLDDTELSYVSDFEVLIRSAFVGGPNPALARRRARDDVLSFCIAAAKAPAPFPAACPPTSEMAAVPVLRSA